MTLEQPTIIYIEDNLDNQRLVQRVLVSRGYQVLVANDGTTGLDLARESKPVLILVDLGIPGLNGYETTTRLRSLKHLDAIPIVALTADTMPGSREKALVAGCDGYLLKPIDTRKLPTQIAEFIAGKRATVPAPAEAQLLRSYNNDLVERLERRVRDLSKANAELQELDRMKNQFLSTLSHELRTPLTSLMGYLELFARGTMGPMSDSQQEGITVMRRNVDVLSRQLNNLLYFQELRSLQFHFVPLRLHERLRPLLNEMQGRATQAGIMFEILVSETAPIVADAQYIELMVRNLIENAIKFNQPGGRVFFIMRDEPSRVIMRIEDNGIGIPVESLEKIFLPFYQVDSSLARIYPGSGLGLAIVRYITEGHGGQVTVRSTPGGGSVFTVVLPRTTS